jgi:hypothetical protein
MIEIGQAKHSTTVIRLDSVFARGDGLPCRTMAVPQPAVRSQVAPRVESEIAYEQTTGEIKADMGRREDQAGEF